MPQNGEDFTDAAGNRFRWEADVELPVSGDLVRYRTTYSSPSWSGPQESVGVLRFLDAVRLTELMAEGGLAVDERFGSWDRSPLTEASTEIITIARPV